MSLLKPCDTATTRASEGCTKTFLHHSPKPKPSAARHSKGDYRENLLRQGGLPGRNLLSPGDCVDQRFLSGFSIPHSRGSPSGADPRGTVQICEFQPVGLHRGEN